MSGRKRGMESTAATRRWSMAAEPPGTVLRRWAQSAVPLPSSPRRARTALKLPSCGYCS